MSFTKKIIRSSNLALRFYVKDGWTIEELEAVAPGGYPYCAHARDTDLYYIYTNASRVPVDKLLERCSQLIRAFDDYPAQSDREFMESHL